MRPLKALLFGATDSAGGSVLQACLLASGVEEVRVVIRRPLPVIHLTPKAGRRRLKIPLWLANETRHKCEEVMANEVNPTIESGLPITIDPEVLGGTPVFRGTRVPVKTLFDYIRWGYSLEEFLEYFPSVTRDTVMQMLPQN